MKDFDAFISHASEDKRYFVRELANKLSEYGAKVWYDEFSLRAGTSLSRSIENGINNSNFGIVVLSKNFFEKMWTEYELKALNSFEVENPGIIIPIWYKVSRGDVVDFSPYLADKLAIQAGKKNIESVALEVLEVIREDLFEELHQKRAWEKMVEKAERKTMKPDEYKKLKIGPVRHESLSIDLITRIRLIRTSLLEVYPHSMEYWLEGFKRDMHPEEEIHIWEKISTCFSESTHVIDHETLKEREEIFSIVLGTFNGSKKEQLNVKNLANEKVEQVIEICSYPFPIYDIKDEKFGENLND